MPRNEAEGLLRQLNLRETFIEHRQSPCRFAALPPLHKGGFIFEFAAASLPLGGGLPAGRGERRLVARGGRAARTARTEKGPLAEIPGRCHGLTKYGMAVCYNEEKNKGRENA